MQINIFLYDVSGQISLKETRAFIQDGEILRSWDDCLTKIPVSIQVMIFIQNKFLFGTIPRDTISFNMTKQEVHFGY